MALYQNWGNLQRLDGMISQDSETSLYLGNQLVLTVDKGSTFGFLKLLYNAELSSNCNILLGVKPRGDASPKIISSENTVLDKDEYDLIVTDQNLPLLFPGNQELSVANNGFRNLQNIHQLLSQYQGALTSSQSKQPQLPLSFHSISNLSCHLDSILNTVQQPTQSFLSPATPSATVDPPVVTGDSEVSDKQSEPSSAPNAKASVQEVSKNSEDVFMSIVEPVSVESINSGMDDSGTSVVEIAADNRKKQTEETRIIDTAEFPFQCKVCHIPFKSKSKFNYHKRKHTEEEPHLCIYCGESFKFFAELSKHRNELHLCNKTFKCDQCAKSFSSKRELVQHSWRHTGKKSHKCNFCGKEYTSESNLSLHKQKHTGFKSLKCSLCPKIFRHKTVLENHIRNSHTGERPFSCRVCDKAFPTTSQLSSHEKRHSDTKPFKCGECSKSFRQRHILKRHSLLHTDERPFKCHLCTKTFRELSNLQYHKRTHTDKSGRSVVCPLCSKKVVIGRGVKRHLELYHNFKCANESDAKRTIQSLRTNDKGSEATVVTNDLDTAVFPIGKNSTDQRLNSSTSECSKNEDMLKNAGEPPGNLLSGNENRTVNQLLLSTSSGQSKGKEKKKEAMFSCSICQKKFCGVKTLANHMKLSHSDCRVIFLDSLRKSNNEKCLRCSLIFANRDLLKAHTCRTNLRGDDGRVAAPEGGVKSSKRNDILSADLVVQTLIKSVAKQAVLGSDLQEFCERQGCENSKLVEKDGIGTLNLKDSNINDEDDQIDKDNDSQKDNSNLKDNDNENLKDNDNDNKIDEENGNLNDNDDEIDQGRDILMDNDNPKDKDNDGHHQSPNGSDKKGNNPNDMCRQYDNKNASENQNDNIAEGNGQSYFEADHALISAEETELQCCSNDNSSNGNVLNERSRKEAKVFSIRRLEGKLVRVLESRRREHALPECSFDLKMIPVVEPDILSIEPPNGYSFAFLPILVPNESAK